MWALLTLRQHIFAGTSGQVASPDGRGPVARGGADEAAEEPGSQRGNDRRGDHHGWPISAVGLNSLGTSPQQKRRVLLSGWNGWSKFALSPDKNRFLVLFRWLAHGLGKRCCAGNRFVAVPTNQSGQTAFGGGKTRHKTESGRRQRCAADQSAASAEGRQRGPARGSGFTTHQGDPSPGFSGPGSCRVFCPTTQKMLWPREAGRRMKARCLGRIENPAGWGAQNRIGEFPIYIQTVIVDFLN